MSFLKHVGQVIGRILGIVAKDAKPIADLAAPVAAALFPQFAPEIAAADALVTKIAQQAVAAEALAAAGAAASGGPEKLRAVLENIGPSIDNWVASCFPGAKQVSDVAKSGLVNAVVAILNELQAPPAATTK